MRVLFVQADRDGCGYVRCQLPAEALSRRPGFEAIAVNRVAEAEIRWADVVVWQRQHRDDLVPLRELAAGLGKVQVFEIDDFLPGIRPSSPAHRAYHYGSDSVKRIAGWVRACDAMTVSTTPLAEEYRSYCQRIEVLPNCIDPSRWTPATGGADGVRLGWAGTPTHQEDLALVIDAVQEVLAERDDVTLVMLGYDGGFPERGVPVEMHDFVPMDEYPAALASLQLDLALAPLADNRFNRSKSSIKFLEYSALGIPCIASACGPYAGEDGIDHGRTGFLARRHRDWVRWLRTLIDDVELRRSTGARARENVLARYAIDARIDRWDSFFRGLVEGRKDASPTATLPRELLYQTRMLAGAALCRNGRFPEGMVEFRQAADILPDQPQAHLLLARAQAAAGHVEDSRRSARHALSLASGNRDVINAVHDFLAQLPAALP